MVLVIKALALGLIWYLFFSPGHRVHVDGEVTGERFGLGAATNRDAAVPLSSPTEKSHD